MPNLTIKQIPEELLQALRERAEITGRSMNREVIACLQSAVMPAKQTAQEIIAERKALWQDLGMEGLPPYHPSMKREGQK
ncbi:MAG: Arc family DNA-binding protein [Rhodothermales bacterium]|nr:Arc family DNA-binding protein [Rhodothermales bacterium]MBO6778701.1 Arc family DNA-binding protein [Rhodothermales bacterium]